MPPPALFKLLEERTLKHLIIWDDELRQLARQGVLLPWNLFHQNDYLTFQAEPKKLPRYSSLSMSRGLPRLTTPNMFCAST